MKIRIVDALAKQLLVRGDWNDRVADFVRETGMVSTVAHPQRGALRVLANPLRFDGERPAQVKVRYLDLDGRRVEAEVDGLFATCIQHEIDHLNGVLFIDHISKLKRDRIVKKFTKVAKRTVAEEG